MTEHMPTLDAGLAPGSDVRLTWWGNATVVIEASDRAIVIDPYLHPQQARYQYILCSHEHYDHAYPATVNRLTQGDVFKKIVIPRSCLYPSTRFFSRQLSSLEPHQYVVLYPKHYDRSASRPGDTKYVGHSGTWTDGDESIFPEPNEILMDDWHIEGFEMVGEDPEVPFPVSGHMPQLGFFIEELQSGASFYHFGDNHWTYSEMAAAGGRLDIMLLPIGKMGVDEDARAMDLMKPKIVIPIHWRYEGEDYPIPDLYQRHEPPDQQIRGHYLPQPGEPPIPGQPNSPYEYLEELGTRARERGIALAQIKAGIPHRIA